MTEQRQTPNRLSYPGAPQIGFLKASRGREAKPRICHGALPATPIDWGELLSSQGLQISRGSLLTRKAGSPIHRAEAGFSKQDFDP